jgi:hypothetical protein
MGQLDRHRRGHQPDGVVLTAFRGQKDEGWADSLAAGLKQVRHGLADFRRVLLYFLSEIRFGDREVGAGRSKYVLGLGLFRQADLTESR